MTSLPLRISPLLLSNSSECPKETCCCSVSLDPICGGPVVSLLSTGWGDFPRTREEGRQQLCVWGVRVGGVSQHLQISLKCLHQPRPPVRWWAMHEDARGLYSADPSPTKKQTLSPCPTLPPPMLPTPHGSYPDLGYGWLLSNILTNLQTLLYVNLCIKLWVPFRYSQGLWNKAPGF